MRRRMLVSTALLAAFAECSHAGGVLMYSPGEVPDPYEVARILKPDGARSGTRTRSIRLLSPETQPAAVPFDQVAGNPGEVVPGAKVTEPAALAKGAAEPAPLPSSFGVPVHFAFNSARLAGDTSVQLDAVAKGIQLAGADVRVLIEGHTDAVGSVQYNMVLSQKRAAAVWRYLVERHGINPMNVHVVGMGKSAPLNIADPNAPENRRVEFRAVTS